MYRSKYMCLITRILYIHGCMYMIILFPPSPIPGDLGRGPSHQSHVLEHRDTYGQAQVCSKGHQRSTVDRPCQPSFHWIKFWHIRNPLPQSIRLRLSVLVRYWAGQGEWSLSWTASDGKKNQRTYHSCTTTSFLSLRTFVSLFWFLNPSAR